jgi:hypothetical protein
MMGDFPLDESVVTGVGALCMGEASTDVEGSPCQLDWPILIGRPARVF